MPRRPPPGARDLDSIPNLFPDTWNLVEVLSVSEWTERRQPCPGSVAIEAPELVAG